MDAAKLPKDEKLGDVMMSFICEDTRDNAEKKKDELTSRHLDRLQQ